MTHLYKIKNKQGQLVTFKPNYTQLQLLSDTGGHRYNYYLKYRQGGITTLFAIDELDEALWVPGMTCAIIAHEREALTKIFAIVKRAYDNIPDQLKPITKYDNKNEYQFTHRFDGLPLDSSIYVAMKVRSGTVQKLHITESAFIKDRQELKAGSKQAVPKTGKITEETTGNGFNEFYDDYMEALNNPKPQPMDYKAHFFPWVIEKEYTLEGEIDQYTATELDIKKISLEKYGIVVTDGQLLWRRWKINELKRKTEGVGLSGDQLFKQEYPLTISEAFQSGAGLIFDAEKLDSMQQLPYIQDKNQAPPGIHQLLDLGFTIWYPPVAGGEYYIGCDPSDGNGSDNTCIDIWEYLPHNGFRRQVAQFYGKIRPDEAADYIKLAAEIYNRAFAGVENNMLTTILFLSKIYDNYFFETKIDQKTQKKTKKLGYNTNTATRNVMIDEFVMLFDEDNLEINSTITKSEMKTFVKKDNGKREHADGKHDDALFAAFIANQIIKFKPHKPRVFNTSILD